MTHAREPRCLRNEQMYDNHMNTLSMYYYLSLGFFLIIFIYLYRNQIYIDDKDYLNEMIEHHSMALLTSEEILQKTNSEKVKKLAENIISTQEKEDTTVNRKVSVVKQNQCFIKKLKQPRK